jgi:hypothetical protein
MSVCSSTAALLVLATLGAPAPNLEPTLLQWKFEKGKPFFQETTTQVDQTMTVMGQKIKQSQQQTFLFSWTPEKQEADGSWRIKQRIEAVKMEIDISGNRISYDSTANNNAGGPLVEFVQGLVGAEFTLVIGKDFRVRKVEGYRDFLNKLPVNPQTGPLVQQIITEESLQKMAETAIGFCPGKAVAKGDSWVLKTRLSMGPIGSYATTYRYTYEGLVDKLDQIKVDTEYKYEPPGPNAGGALPFQIVQGELKSTGSKGVMLFNRERGRLESAVCEVTFAGKLTIAIGGQNTDIELTQMQKTTVKTLDANPLNK